VSLPDCEGRGSCQRGLGPSPRGAAGDQDRATIEGEPLATPAVSHLFMTSQPFAALSEPARM